MGNLQSSAAPSSRGGPKSRNKRTSTTGTRDWLLGGATRVLRKPVAPAPAAAEVEAAAATEDHVTVTSRDLRRQRTPPARNDDTDHHADEHQQHRQEHHCSNRRQRRRNDRDDESTRSSSEEEDSSVFADTLTSPQSVYSDARDEPDDIMVVNGGETFGGSTGRTAAATHQAFTIVKHRKVELNPAKLQSAVANGQVQIVESAVRRSNASQLSDGPKDGSVLRRVAKVTLDQATKDQKPVRPKHVPEKLDFRNHEKFEGQVLINWLVSSFSTEERRRDARLLLPQICTDLVTAGVIKQIQDKDATVAGDLFRSDLMYYWARSELINTPSSSPGRIGQPTWLKDKNLGDVENGKDGPASQAYSNSEELQEIQNKTISKQSPFKNGTGIVHKESMQDLENVSDYPPTKSPKPTSLPIRRKKSLSSLSDKFSTLSIDQSNIPVKQTNGNTPDETVIKKVNGIQSPTKRTSISSTPIQNSKDTPSSPQSSNGGDSSVFYTPVGVNDPTYNGLSPITTPKSSSLNKIVFGGLTPIFDPISDNSTITQSADSLLSSPEVAIEAIKCDFSTNSPTLKNENDAIDEKKILTDAALSPHVDNDNEVASTTNTIPFSPKNNIKTLPRSENPISPVSLHPIPEISVSLPIPPPPPPPPPP
uniref:Protein cappuccino n=1 Tax=Melanaphis sacchari TaxID=742174 RepID=A0A2H8TLZ9_9HEMI